MCGMPCGNSLVPPASSSLVLFFLCMLCGAVVHRTLCLIINNNASCHSGALWYVSFSPCHTPLGYEERSGSGRLL